MNLILAEKPYAAVQGEGRFVGYRMLFVRIQGCPVGCEWCDSYYTWMPFAEQKVPKGIKKTVKPIDMPREGLPQIIADSAVQHVWFTGGEPTTQSDQIADFIQWYREMHSEVKFHICTAGYRYDKRLFDLLDYVTVDLKPPSSKTISKNSVVEKIYCQQKGKLEFKMVVANTKEDKDFAYAMAKSYNDVPFTMQPLYISEPKIFEMNKILSKVNREKTVAVVNVNSTATWQSVGNFADWVQVVQKGLPHVRLGLQLHKHLYPNTQRGI